MSKAQPTKKKYSIVTTCKGRLKDLRHSLPQFLKQDDAEVIVVDYDCPDGTEEYVRNEQPSARVISVDNRPKYSGSHARNIGAQIAHGQVLVFMDADVVVADDFLKTIEFPADEMVYGFFSAREGANENSLRGSCLIRRQDFAAIDGYDELLSGYEGEDLDIYMRLRNLGARPLLLRSDKITRVIEQSLEERTRYRPSNIKLQFLRGQLYQLAKEMVLRTQGNTVVDLNFRKIMLGKINAQLGEVYAGRKEFNFTVTFPDKYKRGFLKEWEFSTAITVKAKHL